jgi:hypothetical protein
MKRKQHKSQQEKPQLLCILYTKVNKNPVFSSMSSPRGKEIETEGEGEAIKTETTNRRNKERERKRKREVMRGRKTMRF